MRQNRPVIGSDIRHVDSVASTMDELARIATDGGAEGLVLWADEQSAGRGRHRRAWVSQPGKDLLFSILFRPRPAIAGEINMILSLAISDLVAEACSAKATIKWPNDVRIGGSKIAGILLESSQGAKGIVVVAGIGLNVNSEMKGVSPGGTDAISMSELAGRSFDREILLRDLLGRIDELYSQVRAGGTVVPAWSQSLETIGQRVQITFVTGSGDHREIAGLAESVDEVGRLIVRDGNGRAWPVAAGEVTLA